MAALSQQEWLAHAHVGTCTGVRTHEASDNTNASFLLTGDKANSQGPPPGSHRRPREWQVPTTVEGWREHKSQKSQINARAISSLPTANQ